MEHVVIDNLDKVIQVLNKHERLIFKNRKDTKNLGVSVLCLSGGLIFVGLGIREMKKRMDNTATIDKLRDQIDAQEERILQLELEKEKLKEEE